MQLHGSIMHEDFRFPKALSYNLSNAVVVLSKMRREFLKNFGVNAHYIPNPIIVDAANFAGRDAKKSSNVILWVGRISPDKNPAAVVAIMKEVVKKIPSAKLKILGAADNKTNLENFKNLIKENQLAENIELCGYHTDTKNFYEQADVLLNTSPHEGWSLVIAESKFYESPLVLYELPDNELTQDGKGYISVAKGDSYAAAQAIIKILTDTDFRRKLSAQARESIQPFLNYDIGGAWQRFFDDLENDFSENLRDSANAQIQNILLEEIFKLQSKK
jgi:glycosyltransferase involved in cell wall biosynthesis